MPDSLIEALRREWAIEKELRACGKGSPHGLVWYVKDGGPISSRNLDRQFKGLLDKAELPDMRFHDLRHTHATWLYSVNADPETMKKRLGHTDLATSGIYIHPEAVPEVDRKVAADIDKLVNPGKPKAPEGTTS
jgi:integrase